MNIVTNSIQPIVTLIRKRRVQVDPRFRGELTPYHAVANIRASYFRRNGLTIDELGEVLLDSGFVAERPTEREVLDLLDRIFTASPAALATGGASEDDVMHERDAELRKARANRHRAYSCQCGKSALRATRLDLLLTCGYCEGRVVRIERTVHEILHNVPLSVVQSPNYRVGDAVGFESVPF